MLLKREIKTKQETQSCFQTGVKKEKPKLVRRNKFPNGKNEKPILLKRRKNPLSKESKNNILCDNKEKQTLPYIKMWEDAGGVKHRKGTKTYQNIIEGLSALLRGKFFKRRSEFQEYKNYKLTPLDFEISLNRYSIALKSDKHLPLNKKLLRVGLIDFFWNPWGKFKISQSLFLHFLKNEPIQRINLDDSYPELTQQIIKKYTDNVVVINNGEMTDKDLSKFIKSSKLTHNFFAEHRNRLIPYIDLDLETMARLLFKAIEKDIGDFVPINPGMFCSNKTFNYRLPIYLKHQALLKEQNVESPLS